jgi:hypothetical protein
MRRLQFSNSNNSFGYTSSPEGNATCSGIYISRIAANYVYACIGIFIVTYRRDEIAIQAVFAA